MMKFTEHSTLLAMAIPLFVLPVMGPVFWVAERWLGRPAGYLLGFAVYWLACLLLPCVILGKQGFLTLLKNKTALFQRKNWLAALLWLTVMVVTVTMYGQDFVRAPLILILTAVPLGLFNGLCEEILWRGLYVRLFPENIWLGVVYPAAGFALWHFVPQSIFPAGNTVGFVLSALLLGLANGFIAYRTSSAKWTAIAHGFGGVLALGGWLAASLLVVLNISYSLR